MGTAHGNAKAIGLILLAVTLTLTISSSFTYAIYETPYPLENFDFTLTAGTTLIKIQPGQSGTLVLWVSPYCGNSTSIIRCDSTSLQSVTLQSSGCPASSFCMLDRTRVLVPPLYGAASDFVVYSFGLNYCTIQGCQAPPGATTVTVTGTDQYGHSHSTQFGVIVCWC